MRQYLRRVLVGLLISGMVVDAASACRLFGRLCRVGTAQPACEVSCQTSVPCSPAQAVDCSVPCAPADPCCSSEFLSDEVVVVAEPQPAMDDCTICSDAAAAAVVPAEVPLAQEAPSLHDSKPQPASQDEPPSLAEPSQEAASPGFSIAPAEQTPPLLAEPSASTPPIMPAPAEEPASPTPEIGDRYSGGAEIFDPTDTKASDPVTPPLTNTSNVPDSVTEPFEAPVPATEFQPTEPAEAMPAPAEDPEPGTDLSDLFGPSPVEEPIEEEPADAETSEPQSDNQETPADTAPPSEEPAEEDDLKTDLDDLFSQDANWKLLYVAGGLHGSSLRTWTNTTGCFSCEARLVKVSARHVVLQRADASHFKVALRQLSDADLQFVREQVRALRTVQVLGSAEKLAVAWAD